MKKSILIDFPVSENNIFANICKQLRKKDFDMIYAHNIVSQHTQSIYKRLPNLEKQVYFTHYLSFLCYLDHYRYGLCFRMFVAN